MEDGGHAKALVHEAIAVVVALKDVEVCISGVLPPNLPTGDSSKGNFL